MVFIGSLKKITRGFWEELLFGAFDPNSRVWAIIMTILVGFVLGVVLGFPAIMLIISLF